MNAARNDKLALVEWMAEIPGSIFNPNLAFAGSEFRPIRRTTQYRPRTRFPQPGPLDSFISGRLYVNP